MRVGDEVLYFGLVLGEEGVDIGLVEEARPLGLGQNEVGQDKESDVGVERDPGYDVPGPGLKEGEKSERDPVHQPWCQLSGVGGSERFVGCEDGKEDCEQGTT